MKTWENTNKGSEKNCLKLTKSCRRRGNKSNLCLTCKVCIFVWINLEQNNNKIQDSFKDSNAEFTPLFDPIYNKKKANVAEKEQIDGNKVDEKSLKYQMYQIEDDEVECEIRKDLSPLTFGTHDFDKIYESVR